MPGKLADRKALVFGASGLVGKYLIDELNDHYSYSFVKVFTRRPLEFNKLKLEEVIIDPASLEEKAHLITGDDLFICLGTTIRKAGSVKKVEEIDRDYAVRIAQIAHANGVTRVAVISSLGANPSSHNYYLRIKGEMEEQIRQIPFDQIVIVRPSILFGKRSEFRLGEIFGRIFMKAFGFLLFGPARKYRGIHGHTVALAMIALIRSRQRKIVYQSDELQKFGKK